MIYDAAEGIQHCLAWMKIIIVSVVHWTPEPADETVYT